MTQTPQIEPPFEPPISINISTPFKFKIFTGTATFSNFLNARPIPGKFVYGFFKISKK